MIGTTLSGSTSLHIINTDGDGPSYTVVGVNGSAGSSGSTEYKKIRPRNIALMYIIKY